MSDTPVPSSPSPTPPAVSSGKVENYEFLRFLAYLIDAFLVTCASIVISQFLSMPMLLNIALYVAYDTYFTVTKGASIGKSVIGLKVIDAATGKLPSQQQALKRSIIKAIPFVGIILLIQMLLDRLPFHDEFAKTRVLKTA